jgi:membrane-associated protein
MSLQGIVQQVFSFAGSFNANLLIFLFLICAIGELGITIPYLLETVWLLSGFNVSNGTLSVCQVFILWLTAQAGRQGGAILLYYLSRLGMMPFVKLYHRYFPAHRVEKFNETHATPFKLLRKIDLLSPFSVAMARLLWLRVPLTFALGTRNRLSTLILGIMLSSFIWDGIYITIGLVVGTRVALEPAQMVLYSLGALTLLYITMFTLKFIFRRRHQSQRQNPAPSA